MVALDFVSIVCVRRVLCIESDEFRNTETNERIFSPCLRAHTRLFSLAKRSSGRFRFALSSTAHLSPAHFRPHTHARKKAPQVIAHQILGVNVRAHTSNVNESAAARRTIFSLGEKKIKIVPQRRIMKEIASGRL